MHLDLEWVKSGVTNWTDSHLRIWFDARSQICRNSQISTIYQFRVREDDDATSGIGKPPVPIFLWKVEILVAHVLPRIQRIPDRVDILLGWSDTKTSEFLRFFGYHFVSLAQLVGLQKVFVGCSWNRSCGWSPSFDNKNLDYRFSQFGFYSLKINWHFSGSSIFFEAFGKMAAKFKRK